MGAVASTLSGSSMPHSGHEENELPKIKGTIAELESEAKQFKGTTDDVSTQRLLVLQQQLVELRKMQTVLLKLKYKDALAEHTIVTDAREEDKEAAGLPWWYSKTLAHTGFAISPPEQATAYLSIGGGVWAGTHYWRKARALMQVEALRGHAPEKALEIEAIHCLTEGEIRHAKYFAAKFRRMGIAAAVGGPLLMISWLQATRVVSKPAW